MNARDAALERTLEGRVLTPAGWVQGSVRFGPTILAVVPGRVAPDAPFVLPGFVDVHVHGGGGHDTMDGPDGVRGLAAFHARHGTTALVATTITNPWPRVVAALQGVREAVRRPGPGARVLGAHLEGPFISPRRLGAQPPHAVDPAPELVDEALATGVVRVVTVAPELPGAIEAIRNLAAAGVRASLGHSVADAEVGTAALRAGARGGTHLFNAMGGIEGRRPGIAGALLADPEAFVELILDTHHVHPTAFRTALAAKPERLVLVTDSIRAAGLEDGFHDLGGRQVRLERGVVRLPDGTLAGSVLTMVGAVRNAVAAGVPLGVAARLASAHPAAYLGLAGKGRIEPGCDADLVVLSAGLEVLEVWLAGERQT